MSVLIIGAAEQAAIDAALARARKRPIPFDIAKALAIDQTTDMLTLEDRERAGGDFFRPKSQQVLLPVGYRLEISYEQQPAGLCLHISLSIDGKPGKLPQPAVLEQVARACGMAPFAASGRSWVEEFTIDGKPGGLAANAVVVVEPAPMGPRQ